MPDLTSILNFASLVLACFGLAKCLGYLLFKYGAEA